MALCYAYVPVSCVCSKQRLIYGKVTDSLCFLPTYVLCEAEEDCNFVGTTYLCCQLSPYLDLNSIVN